MQWVIDPASSAPLFEQVAGQVRRGVAEGRLVSGDRLPSAKQLADDLEINLHTVLRAYQVLRDEGLVDLRRGRGAVVTASDPGTALLTQLVDALVEQAKRLHLSQRDLVALIKERA